MNIIAVISNMDGSHEEHYIVPDNTTDDQILDKLEEIIKYYNNTLRTGELPRVLGDVHENLDKDDPYANALVKHIWHKTNLVTIMRGHSSYDTYRCDVCGITATRFGLGEIRRDKKYSGSEYLCCKLE